MYIEKGKTSLCGFVRPVTTKQNPFVVQIYPVSTNMKKKKIPVTVTSNMEKEEKR